MSWQQNRAQGPAALPLASTAAVGESEEDYDKVYALGDEILAELGAITPKVNQK